MKKVILLLGIVALLVLVWVVRVIVDNARDARIKQHLMSVKIGMSRAEVLAITGEPKARKTLTVSPGAVSVLTFDTTARRTAFQNNEIPSHSSVALVTSS